LGKVERYARAAEFLTIVRRLWEEESVDFSGDYYQVTDAKVITHPVWPELFFGGSSDAAIEVAAAHADVYLTWGEPPQAVAEKVARVRDRAAGLGREIRFGIRLHAITRDTSEEAWHEADRLLAGLSDEQIASSQAVQRASQSEGQRRMTELHKGSTDSLEIYPNLWAGVGLVRGGAGTALVGSHEEVADRIAEYHELGIDEFILSGYPHLEEAYRVGEGVIPELRRRGLMELPVSAPVPAIA
jgi:alkanesulfonate monooxygenase